MRHLAPKFSVVLTLFFILYCVKSLPVEATEPIRILAMYNLTGVMASIDQPGFNGAKLAAQLINDRGGLLNGRMIEIIGIDTKSDPNLAVSEAKRVLDQNIVAGIGYGDSTYVLSAAPEFQAKGTPFITSGATHPQLPERIGDRLFMVPFGDNDQAFAIAEFAYNRLRARTAVIWTDDSTDFTKTLTYFFKKRFMELGAKVLKEELFMADDKDFSSHIAHLKSMEYEPGIIFIAATPNEAGLTVKQIRDAGIEIPIVSGDGFDTKLITTLPGRGKSNFIFFATHAFRGDGRPEVTDFIDAYKNRFGTPPETAFAALGFDAVGLIADAIIRAGTTEKDALSKALSSTKGYKSVTGEISYTRPSRVPVKPVSIIGVMHGKYKLVEIWIPGHP